MQKRLTILIASFITAGFLTGCASTSDVMEDSPAQEATPENTTPAEPVQAEPEPKVSLEKIFYFDYDDATIQPSALPVIKAHAERIKNSPETIRIEGHADERGTDTYNQQLGKRRAEAVRDVLLSLGVNSSKIETVSHGEKSPLASGSDEFSWQKNRRVELK